MPKRWREALGPLEVVEQRPREVAAHVGAVVDRAHQLPEVAVEIVDPVRVTDVAVRVGPGRRSRSRSP